MADDTGGGRVTLGEANGCTARKVTEHTHGTRKPLLKATIEDEIVTGEVRP